MTAARSDRSRMTTTPLTHTCSNDGTIQVGPSLGSDAMFEVVFCTPYLAVRSTRYDQPDLNLVNSEVTVAER